MDRLAATFAWRANSARVLRRHFFVFFRLTSVLTSQASNPSRSRSAPGTPAAAAAAGASSSSARCATPPSVVSSVPSTPGSRTVKLYGMEVVPQYRRDVDDASAASSVPSTPLRAASPSLAGTARPSTPGSARGTFRMNGREVPVQYSGGASSPALSAAGSVANGGTAPATPAPSATTLATAATVRYNRSEGDPSSAPATPAAATAARAPAPNVGAGVGLEPGRRDPHAESVAAASGACSPGGSSVQAMAMGGLHGRGAGPDPRDLGERLRQVQLHASPAPPLAPSPARTAASSPPGAATPASVRRALAFPSEQRPAAAATGADAYAPAPAPAVAVAAAPRQSAAPAAEHAVFAPRGADRPAIDPKRLGKAELLDTMHTVHLDPRTGRALPYEAREQVRFRAAWELPLLQGRLVHVLAPIDLAAGTEGRKASRAAFERARDGGLDVPGLGRLAFLLQTDGQMHEKNRFEGTFVLDEPEAGAGAGRGRRLAPEDVLGMVYSLADFEGVEEVKRNARVGSLFSKCLPVATVEEGRVRVEEDIKAPGSGAVMTDGCGLISPRLFDAVRRQLERFGVREHGRGECRTYLQIRLGGVKGMVVRAEGLPEGVDLVVRPSMIKYSRSVERTLYVVAFDHVPREGRVNGQAIACLEAAGVPRHYFLEAQREAADGAADALASRRAAGEFLRRGAAGAAAEAAAGDPAPREIALRLLRILEAGFDPYDPASGKGDPYVRRILLRFIEPFVRSLESRVPPRAGGACFWLKMVPESLVSLVSAAGRPNPAPVPRLKPGQVYVRLGGKEPLVGPLALCRNPIYERGAVQLVHAVDVPEWTAAGRHGNALVCSVLGDAPLASLLSDGDYDGDDVLVIDDSEVAGALRAAGHGARPPLPPIDLSHEIKVATDKTRMALRAARGRAAFHRAACELFLAHDKAGAGLLDWRQRVWARTSPAGVADEKARACGARAIVAINASKSGAFLAVPRSLDPPFGTAVELDGDLKEVPGAGGYLAFAERLRDQYSRDLARLVREAEEAEEGKGEGEDFRGVAVRRAEERAASKAAAARALAEECWGECVAEVRRQRPEFEGGDLAAQPEHPELLAVAAALYVAAYAAAETGDGAAGGAGLSLPWNVAPRQLCAAKRAALALATAPIAGRPPQGPPFVVCMCT
eukprot:tig00000310_g23945.t1